MKIPAKLIPTLEAIAEGPIRSNEASDDLKEKLGLLCSFYCCGVAKYWNDEGIPWFQYEISNHGRTMLALYRLEEDELRIAPDETEKVSLDEQALAIFLKHKCSKAEIARRLGKLKQSLSPDRCPQLDAAYRAWKTAKDPGQLRGSKDREGNLEAWEEEDET